MNLEEFKKKCMEYAVRRDSCYNTLYASNAICGEAGELANYIKKVYRDHQGCIPGKIRVSIKKEIFDVMWYCMYLCDIMNINPENLADMGFHKLIERRAEKTPSHGEG